MHSLHLNPVFLCSPGLSLRPHTTQAPGLMTGEVGGGVGEDRRCCALPCTLRCQGSIGGAPEAWSVALEGFPIHSLHFQPVFRISPGRSTFEHTTHVCALRFADDWPDPLLAEESPALGLIGDEGRTVRLARGVLMVFLLQGSERGAPEEKLVWTDGFPIHSLHFHPVFRISPGRSERPQTTHAPSLTLGDTGEDGETDLASPPCPHGLLFGRPELKFVAAEGFPMHSLHLKPVLRISPARSLLPQTTQPATPAAMLTAWLLASSSIPPSEVGSSRLGSSSRFASLIDRASGTGVSNACATGTGCGGGTGAGAGAGGGTSTGTGGNTGATGSGTGAGAGG
eukprot:Hpha_TRINITY_DN16268_c2_g5::TRINITY_DN16268_c2_g5_i1::g.11916::m.11916